MTDINPFREGLPDFQFRVNSNILDGQATRDGIY